MKKQLNTEKAPAAIGPYSLNAQAILRSAELDLSNVVKTTVLLSDISNFAAMNEVYAEFFSAPYPGRSAFAVKDLPKGALVEIEMIAVR